MIAARVSFFAVEPDLLNQDSVGSTRPIHKSALAVRGRLGPLSP